MTIRTDVTIDYSQSPRVAIVAAPSTEYVMQDLVDTERNIESSFQGMSEPKLLNASGKEDLGGGVSVGITVAHQDTLVAFEGRFTPAETSTITTASSAPVIGTVRLIDNTATFISNNVQRGSYYINFDDRSVGDVVEVISETELRVTTPVNGDFNNFEVGDRYDVYNVEQCNATGGNLTAVDDLGAAISAILPTWGTQVILTLSTSASIVEGLSAAAIVNQVADIHGQIRRSIYIDTSAVAAGDGYQQTPYNNVTTAIDDAETNGITSLIFLADATLDRQLRNFEISGVGDPVIDLNGQDIRGSRFSWVSIDGTGIGTADYERCSIRTNVAGMEGHMHRCGIQGAVEMAVNGSLVMEHCYSEVAGLSTPSISLNTASTTAALSVRLYSGGIQIEDSQAAGCNTTVEVPAGRIKLAASNTAGTISVRGTADLDDSSGGATIDKEALLWPKTVLTIKKFLGLK